MDDKNCWQEKFETCIYSDRLIYKLMISEKYNGSLIDINEVKKAIFYAKKYHANQLRQSGEPYYSHPIEVAYFVSDYLLQTDIIIIAILHDILEDTSMTYANLRKIFGYRVASGVMDLTRIVEEGHKISVSSLLKSLWKQKKYDILMVKLFDRLHNINTIYAKSPHKIKLIVDETLRYFLILSEVMEIPELADDLYKKCYNANLSIGIIDKTIHNEAVEFR